MYPGQLYLKFGVEPSNASRTLRDLVIGASNVRGVAGGPGSATKLRDKYLDWIELAEVQLASLTHRDEVLRMLQTDRYWRIREIGEDSVRPWPLVSAEIDYQVAGLERLADDLGARVKRLTQAPGCITVLDTNVLLEFQPPQSVNWLKVIGEDDIRLIVPLRVIEELDAKKYSRRTDLADRARRLLSQIEGVLGVGDADLPCEVRPRVTIEVPVDSSPRRRRNDADEEILETCEELGQLSGHQVTLITADTAMRLRASARSIKVVRMPSEYSRVKSTTASQTELTRP